MVTSRHPAPARSARPATAHLPRTDTSTVRQAIGADPGHPHLPLSVSDGPSGAAVRFDSPIAGRSEQIGHPGQLSQLWQLRFSSENESDPGPRR
jgi:hypothetical protein